MGVTQDSNKPGLGGRLLQSSPTSNVSLMTDSWGRRRSLGNVQT